VSTKVVVVGGLPQHGNRNDLLRRLAEQQPTIEWDWIQHENAQFQLPTKYFNRFLHELRVAKSKNDAALPIVVKMYHINGRDESMLYREYDDPILAPRDLTTIDELATWLLSSQAGIVPPTTWILPVRAVGLLAVLSKLVRNKSWNKDVQGHMWTKESDLLGQAPVQRPEFPEVYLEACNCLEKAVADGLLLTKGGKQGKTPKEFSINIVFLPAVKRTIVGRDPSILKELSALAPLMEFVDRGPQARVEVDSVIISEKVLETCRAPDRGSKKD